MNFNSIDVFLFDIEGTTSPISFVHEVMFPYSKRELSAYLQNNGLSTEVYILLKEEYKKDRQQNIYTAELEYTNRQSIENYLKFLIQVDRKSTALKEIQGKIWKKGFESGEIQSILYEDVPPFFEKIKENQKRIGIYSSGSIEAQKLVFRFSNRGDLSSYISYYFDTKIGAKREANSYKEIAKQVNISAEKILFFTDIKEEAEAAQEASIRAIILNRPGNTEQGLHNFSILHNFQEFS